jgi:glycerol-3-phosphate acyltransferase PlsY
MTTPLLLCLVAVGSYLVGAVPFGYLVGRTKGIDVRKHGSGNVGATNVGRLLGAGWGVLVFVLDFAKGAAPVAVARFLVMQPDDVPADAPAVLAGTSAFLGHLFPVYLGFKGGKGVATGAGVVAVLVPLVALIVLAAWVAVVLLFRYVSLASIAAAVLLIVLRLAFCQFGGEHPFGEGQWVTTAFCLVGGVLVVVRHHSNVRRLIAGTETRLFGKKEEGKA